MKVLAIIPARGGSKGIKNKNIKLFRNKPLIYWSIKIAKDCKHINKIVCSTDSESIKEIAIESGAEVPFLRPNEISGDLSTDLEFTDHCLKYLEENENYIPDIIVHLRPTYPTRSLDILNRTIELFIKNRDSYNSLRTVIKFNKSPYKMYKVIGKRLVPLFEEVNNIKKPYNKCRQELPETYLHNGYIDIFNYKTIIDTKSVTGNKILSYIMNKNEYNDIDTIKDWKEAENINKL